MCLIASRENGGSHISNAIIDSNFQRNPDGFGIAWRADSGLLWKKFAPDEKKKFREVLKSIDATGQQYVAHWRLATHGPACLDLSHPFSYIDDEGTENVVFHNGVITSVPTKKDESDTSAYVNRVLANLPARWWENAATKWLVEETIGWSRLLVMTNDTTVYLRDKEWKVENGIKYSTNPLPYTSTKIVTTHQTNRVCRKCNGLESGTNVGYHMNLSAEANHAFDPDVRVGKITPVTSLLLPGSDDVDEDDFDEDVIIEDRRGMSHLGHSVSIITGNIKEDDQVGVIVCDVCGTSGEYYVEQNGKTYIDLRHLASMLS